MKVRDLIEQEIDVDVYDDVCDEIGIAFCGPIYLTEQGKEKFSEVLDYEVKLHTVNGYENAQVKIDDDDEKVWKRRLKKAKEFFWAAAGYCPADDWDQWFSFEEEQRQEQKTINVLGDTQREQWKSIVHILRATGGDMTYEGRAALCDELDRYIDHCEDILDGLRKEQEG